MPSTEQPNRPECPRCGYDQTGAVESCRESCPLTGVCPECGLKFEWRTLLNTQIAIDPLNFESQLRLSARRFLAIAWMGVTAWRLWRRLKMTDTLRPLRAASVSLSVAVTLVALANILIPSALFWAVHLQDVWTVNIYRDGRVLHTLGPTPNKRLAESYVQSIDGASTPQGELSTKLTSTLVFTQSFDESFNRCVAAVDPSRNPIVLVIATWFSLVPLCVLAMRLSMRQARVKPRHLLRLFIYSLPQAPIAVAAVGAATLGPQMFRWWNADHRWGSLRWSEPGTVTLSLSFATVSLVFFFYWATACRRYLKMDHGGLLAAAAVLLAGVSALAIGSEFFGLIELVADWTT